MNQEPNKAVVSEQGEQYATPEFEGVLKLHEKLRERDKAFYGSSGGEPKVTDVAPTFPPRPQPSWDDGPEEDSPPVKFYRASDIENYCMTVEIRIEELEAELARVRAGGWRDCKQELPPQREEVLVYFENTGIKISSWFRWETMEAPLWGPGIREWGKVTHWQPLPTPPKDTPNGE